jgi:hypothetical protein
MWKEVIMAQFKILSQDLLVEIEGNYKMPQSKMVAEILARHLKKVGQK